MIPGIVAGGALAAEQLPYRVPVTVPAQNVGAELAHFPVWVDLADMPAGFWQHLAHADGGDIRVRDSNGADIPFDLVKIDTEEKTGSLFFRHTLSDETDTTAYIYYGNPAFTGVSPTAPNGRHAVWSDYEVVYLFVDSGDLTDRTGKHDLIVETGTPSFEVAPLSAGGGLNIGSNLRLVTGQVLAGSTTFTMAASGTFSDLSSNRSLAAYLATLDSNTGRTTIGTRAATGRYTNWDNTNSWNDGSTASTNTPVRIHGVWNGSTAKHLYVNGALDATDSSVSSIGGSNDIFVVGEGGASSSFHRGRIGFVYLRLHVLPAAWIAAEYANLAKDAGDEEPFYTVGPEDEL